MAIIRPYPAPLFVLFTLNLKHLMIESCEKNVVLVLEYNRVLRPLKNTFEQGQRYLHKASKKYGNE